MKTQRYEQIEHIMIFFTFVVIDDYVIGLIRGLDKTAMSLACDYPSLRMISFGLNLKNEFSQL
jgi:accessory gene regulator protein AgrB